MDVLWNGFTPLESLYGICALLGGGLFAVRLVLQILGLGGDGLLGNLEGSDAGVGDSDISFKALSLQGISAFLTLFGLTGLAMEQAGTAAVFSVPGASAAGLFAVWVIQKLFTAMGKLQSKGNIDLQNAVGAEGTVYLRIAPSQRGKVEVTIQNHLRVLDAVAGDDQQIDSGERVRILQVLNSNVLLVEPIRTPQAD